MKPLDLESRRLIDEATAADVPPPGLESKLWQTLSQRVGQPLPPTAAAASHALGAGAKLGMLSGLTAKLLIGAGLLGTVAGAYGVHGLLQQPPAASQRSPTRESTVLAAQPAAAPPAAQPAAALPAAQPAAAAPAQPPLASSSLLEETQLLANVQRALSAGAPAKALMLLDQHREQFPHGELAQERDAARVFALCELGRAGDAQRERRRFLRSWPDSPLGARVRAGCAPSRRH